jgi:hypothetical protein
MSPFQCRREGERMIIRWTIRNGLERATGENMKEDKGAGKEERGKE